MLETPHAEGKPTKKDSILASEKRLDSAIENLEAFITHLEDEAKQEQKPDLKYSASFVETITRLPNNLDSFTDRLAAATDKLHSLLIF